MTCDFRLFQLSNCILVIPRRCEVSNKRLFALESRLQLKRSPSTAGIEPGTARSAGQVLTS